MGELCLLSLPVPVYFLRCDGKLLKSSEGATLDRSTFTELSRLTTLVVIRDAIVIDIARNGLQHSP